MPDSSPVSPRAAEVIRTATMSLLQDPESLFTEVDDTIFAAQPGLPRPDAQLAAAISASTRSNLAHWATSQIADPGQRVQPNMVPETVELAREIVRRGYDDAALAGYRIGQNIAWQRWMDAAFTVCEDPADLREVLTVTYRSTAAFVDEMLTALRLEMERERELLSSRARSDRLEAVSLVLENAPIGELAASRRLRYELARTHLAAVAWSDDIGPRDPEALAAAIDALARELGDGGLPLTAAPNASTLWGWFAVPAGTAPDAAAVTALAAPRGRIRVAIGRPAAGIDGFRRSHRQALLAQALMRRQPSDIALTVASYAELEVASLASVDEDRAAEFVTQTLGALASAEPVLRETLRVFLAAQCNVSATARSLFTHRNTVLGRLKRAEQLLDIPLERHVLEVSLALELEHRLGS